MKKQTLFLGLALLITSVCVSAQWSGHWGGDTSRKHVTIKHIGDPCYLPVIDGKPNDAVWRYLPPIPIERNWKNRPYSPTLYSSFFKAFYTDTTICILVQNKDDSFWPSWKANLSDYLCDKVELYFGVNGIGTNDGAGGAQLGKKAGLYQVTQNYQRHSFMGTDTAGNLPYTHEASTYIYSADGDTVYETIEWVVNFKALRNSLTTDSAALDPFNTNKILFDITVSDLDSTVDQAQRYRQGWSNIGWPDESWANMDSCGVLTFEIWDCCVLKMATDPCVAVREISSTQSVITPTLVSDFINVPLEVYRIEVIDIMGRSVMQIANNTGKADLSGLTEGIYIVRLFGSSDFIGNQRIIKH
jgi:hypothetical protein